MESQSSNGTNVPIGSQPPIGSLLKQAAGDPRTTNILLAVLVLCITGYMPSGFETICTA